MVYLANNRQYMHLTLASYCSSASTRLLCACNSAARMPVVLHCNLLLCHLTRFETTLRTRMSQPQETRLPNVLIIGTGEYTTGYSHGHSVQSDKKMGVVGLVFFDLRRRQKASDIHNANIP